MHRAIDVNTKYYKLSPAQFIWVRRGAHWQTMLFKTALCLMLLSVLSVTKVDSSAANMDKNWLEAFFLMASLYYLMTSSLYIFSYPLSQIIHELPNKLAFVLLRILFAFLVIASIHLYYGVRLEVSQ